MIQQCEKAASGEDDILLKRWHRSNVEIVNAVEKSGGEEGKSYTVGSTKGPRILQRWVFAVMGCLGITNAFMMRVCLSIAITKMVVKVRMQSNGTRSENICPTTNEGTESLSSITDGTFEWDEYTQGIILSSFYWGYAASHIPAGILSNKFGGKQLLGFSILSSAIFTILTPIVVREYGATGLIVLRLLMGICEGMSFPAVGDMVACWAPPSERSKIGSTIMSGISVGTVLGNVIPGMLIEFSSIGWPIVFYTFGVVGVLWYLVWIVLCYNHPDVHPFITEYEKSYINERTRQHTHELPQSIPWRHMMTSVPLWALLGSKISFALAHHTMAADLPKYLSSVLNFSINANGTLVALPYLLHWGICNGSSWFADWAIKSEKMSRTTTRKIFSIVPSIVGACFLIAASYAGCDRTVVVICFIAGVGVMGASYITMMMNPVDLTPNYASIAMAFTSFVASCAGIVAPYLVGVLTPNQTLSEWRIVFWILVVFLFLSAMTFGIWGDGDVQYWNDLSSASNQRQNFKPKGSHSEAVSSSEHLR